MSTTDCPHCKGICLGLCGSATPSPSPDLAERLKRVGSEVLNTPINPDGPEAAAELSRLRAELDEARAQRAHFVELAEINADGRMAASSALASMREALTIARTTLSELFEHHLHNSESGCEAWNDVGGAGTLHHIDAALKESQDTK